MTVPVYGSSTRVLFIGNSYTSQNDLPGMVEGLVRTLSPEARFETGAVLVGGATLESHWRGADARARLHERAWTHVVLQEQSLLGHLRIDGRMRMNEPEAGFLPAARQFMREIAAVGAQPVLYMTWSREADPAAQEVLTQAYALLARESQCLLVPVGLAWQRVRRERPEVKLYAEDGHHPGPAGTYLAACVFYATLFQRSCVGAPVAPAGPLSEDTVRYLQQVGSEVALASAPEPAPMPSPAFPSLPPGEPLEAARLAGAWRGTLALYPEEMGMSPAPLELTWDVGGARPGGRVRIVFPTGEPLEAEVTPRVADGVLSFSVFEARHLDALLHFQAVLEGDTLRGVAQVHDAEGGRWFGSWSARPRAVS